MKFYNPFKWHIIEQYGRFWVRKFELHGWAYMSTNDSIWSWRFATSDCAFYSIESAQEKLNKYPSQLKEYKDKQKIKVHV